MALLTWLVWAKDHWRLILTLAVVAALSIALAGAKMDARHWRKQADANAVALALEGTRHKITRASVNTLQAALAAKNTESLQRAAVFEQVKAQAVADVAAADQRWRATANQVERLRAIAAGPSSGCAVPVELVNALEGL